MGIGTPPARVRVRPAGPLGVVLSDMEPGTVALQPEDVLAHQEVLGRLLRSRTVLPFRFGSVAQDWAAVEALVARIAADALAMVEKLRDRVEVGLKVLWNKSAVRQRVLGALGPIAEGAGPGPVSRVDAIRVGQEVERVVQAWRDRCIPQILAALGPLSDDLSEGGQLTATMLWNASFLVPRAKEPQFRAAVQALDARWGDCLDFRYASDLPPYSFVQLRYAPEEDGV